MKPPLTSHLERPSRWDWVLPANLRRIFWSVAAVWTMLAAISLQQIWHLLQVGALNLAAKEASNSLAEDLAYRRWAALHGGVYVPVMPGTSPSPYLADVPERDVTTPSGRQLTLLNPEYMIRQVYEMGPGPSGVHRHLTSLKPLRPQNAADSWESVALRALEAGEKEVGAVVNLEGQSYYRLIRPLVVESACLNCHGAQGYNVGDVRGGISTSVPLAPNWAVARAEFLPIAVAHAVLWGVGLAVLTGSYSQTCRRLAERQRAEAALRESEAKFRVLSEESITGVVIVQDERFIYANSAMSRILGYTPEELLGASTSLDCVVEEDRPLVRENMRQRLAGDLNQARCSFRARKKDGALAYLESLGCCIHLEGRASMIATILDTTQRRNEEAERERTIAMLRKAMEEIKVLKGLLPICAWCKKIHDDQGAWTQIEDYVARHTGAEFSHGICPDCLQKLEPDMPVRAEL